MIPQRSGKAAHGRAVPDEEWVVATADCSRRSESHEEHSGTVTRTQGCEIRRRQRRLPPQMTGTTGGPGAVHPEPAKTGGRPRPAEAFRRPRRSARSGRAPRSTKSLCWSRPAAGLRRLRVDCSGPACRACHLRRKTPLPAPDFASLRARDRSRVLLVRLASAAAVRCRDNPLFVGHRAAVSSFTTSLRNQGTALTPPSAARRAGPTQALVSTSSGLSAHIESRSR